MANPYQLFRYVPLSVLRTLARGLAALMMQLPNLSIHNSIRTNLQLAYPQLSHNDRQRLHRQIVINQSLTSVESIKSWAMPPKWSIEQIHTVHNEHLLKEALSNPNGMLAIVPHLGTWEIMNAWLNQFGAPTIMYKPVKGEITDAFILQGRQRLNATLVPTDGTGVKAMLKTLKSGGFSIILPDHVPSPSGGVVVPFFGIPCLSSTLAPKLASKTRCALIGLACIRRNDGKFDIYCQRLENAQLYDKDITIATAALNNAMQVMIAPFETHYMWGYRRFKYVPNIDNIYQLKPSEVQTIATHYHTDIIATQE